jgi:hypothetical protein
MVLRLIIGIDIMFQLIETNGPWSRIVRGVFDTAEAALAAIDNILCADHDDDYPGYWDIIDTFGRLFVIEPVEVV